MTTVSVVLIVKNEAANLAACLDTVRWADEIIVYDSGSSDDTVTIAHSYTDKVYIDNAWHGYGKQRQRAQGRASGDWIFMLDADERVSAELADSIRQAVAQDDRNSVYAVARLSWAFGRFIRHSGWYPDHVLRLYPRERAGYTDALVHERVDFPSTMHQRTLAGDLLHFTYRDLQHYLVKSAGYADAWASERYSRGARTNLAVAIGHGIACFIKMYLLRAGFRDGPQGLLLALLSAHSTFAKYADLWVRGQQARSPR